MTKYKVLNRHLYLFFNISVVCQIVEFITDSVNI